VCRQCVTPDKRARSPAARALASVVSTPDACFLYGGSGPSRLPFCDLWRLTFPAEPGQSGPGRPEWVDCARPPLCAVEHTLTAQEVASAPKTSQAGERVPVGHDAHAWAITNGSHLVVRLLRMQRLAIALVLHEQHCQSCIGNGGYGHARHQCQRLPSVQIHA
jgi:hypothetical protein